MSELTTYYFIGIGGIGMSALAKMVLQKGHRVLGSDLSSTATTQELQALGATIYSSHEAYHIQPGMQVIYSSAITPKNPEWLKAQQLQLPLIHRSDFLDKLMEKSCPLLVTGAHGKTSTTAMLATLLQACGLDPSFSIGGYLQQQGLHALQGSGQYFVAEADESDGSFLKTKAYGAIVTNTDEEHLDYWKNKENLYKAYETFIRQVKNPHLLFLCGEDPFLASLNVQANDYGFLPKASLRILYMERYQALTEFSLSWQGGAPLVFRMPLAGRHQVLNATAAIGLTLQLGGAIDKMQEALLSYTGVKRRLEFLGEAKEVQVFDDYAHHPKEIEVTLQALRQMVGGKRIVTVFQPHRFSRFAYHIEAFAKSLQLADLCIVTDIYSAREEPLPGIHAQNLLYYLPQARYLPKDSLMEQLVTYIAPGDVIVTFGAGDITYCGPLLLKYLRESSPHDSMVT